MKIEVHCDDGSDQNCYGAVEIDLPYTGLSDDNVVVNWTTERGRDIVSDVQISPPNQNWVKQNENSLSDYEIESINENGFFEIAYADLEHKVCGACGSDQTYDAEGNNISHL